MKQGIKAAPQHSCAIVLGRRIAKDVDDGAGGREVTAYVYDGPDILMEFDGAGGFLALRLAFDLACGWS